MYEKLNKKAIGCMLVNALIWAIILTVGAVFAYQEWLQGKLLLLIIIVLFIWVVALSSPFVRYRRYKYRITDEDIDVCEGFLFVNRFIVPIERLHQLSLSTGPIDRIFGLSKVKVTTAGGEVVIRFLETKVAETIAESLKTKINEVAAEEKLQNQTDAQEEA